MLKKRNTVILNKFWQLQGLIARTYNYNFTSVQLYNSTYLRCKKVQLYTCSYKCTSQKYQWKSIDLYYCTCTFLASFVLIIVDLYSCTCTLMHYSYLWFEIGKNEYKSLKTKAKYIFLFELQFLYRFWIALAKNMVLTIICFLKNGIFLK